MNRKGFISVMAILIMAIIFINVTFLLYMGNLQLSLSKASTMNIKSNYIIEDSINRLIYDKKNFKKYFNNTILRNSREQFYSNIKVEKEIRKNEAFKSCDFNIKTEERKTMNLKLISDENDIEKIFKLDIQIINDLFEMDNPLINSENLEHNKRDEFESYLNLLEEKIFDYRAKLGSREVKKNIYNKAEIIIDRDTGRNILLDLENDISKEVLNFTNEILLLSIKNKVSNNPLKPKLILGEENHSEKLNLKGVFYIEGDIIINQDIDLEGIIIINNGNLSIKDDINLNIEGMILYRGENSLNLDNINLIYNRKQVYRYASYLPEYIKPKVILIKKE